MTNKEKNEKYGFNKEQKARILKNSKDKSAHREVMEECPDFDLLGLMNNPLRGLIR